MILCCSLLSCTVLKMIKIMLMIMEDGDNDDGDNDDCLLVYTRLKKRCSEQSANDVLPPSSN